jgi:hypothetical protein
MNSSLYLLEVQHLVERVSPLDLESEQVQM